MKLIPLTQGRVAVVDDEDFDRINQHKWYFDSKNPRETYASRTVSVGNRKYRRISMHREIMGLERGDKRSVDHINHDGLDNRRCNLRVGTNQQNLMNRRKQVTASSSTYKGVSFDTSRNRWIAAIMKDGRTVFLGRFKTETEAATAYDEKARELFGEWAKLNEVACG